MDDGLRCYLLLGLLLVVHEQVVQSVTVEAHLGDSVILPCSANRYQKNVFWRHKNADTVYDIIEGKENFHDQYAVFRGRVEGFPSEFTNGNYSIRLKDVKSTDLGTYSCHIPNSDTQYVELQVKAETRDEEPKSGARGGGVMRSAVGISLFPLLHVLFCSLAV